MGFLSMQEYSIEIFKVARVLLPYARTPMCTCSSPGSAFSRTRHKQKKLFPSFPNPWDSSLPQSKHHWFIQLLCRTIKTSLNSSLLFCPHTYPHCFRSSESKLPFWDSFLRKLDLRFFPTKTGDGFVGILVPPEHKKRKEAHSFPHKEGVHFLFKLITSTTNALSKISCWAPFYMSDMWVILWPKQNALLLEALSGHFWRWLTTNVLPTKLV